MLFPSIVYLLCIATSASCMALLIRGYRQSRTRLLLWSALCFVFLALNNFVVILDLLVLPAMDLRVTRLALSLAAIGLLLFGFIWDLED
jgi:Family of unknown function (DUF5985)